MEYEWIEYNRKFQLVELKLELINLSFWAMSIFCKSLVAASHMLCQCSTLVRRESGFQVQCELHLQQGGADT